MDQAKSQFRGRLEHIVSFRSWRLTNTGPKTARTYKYTCFQALASVLCGELTAKATIKQQSRHGFNAISPNQTALKTSQRGEPVPHSTLAKRRTPRLFNNLRTSRALLCSALLCSAFQQTPPTELPPQRPTQNGTRRMTAKPDQGPERKLTWC